jgi:hypothetical protein
MCALPDIGLPLPSSPGLWTTTADWSYLLDKFRIDAPDPEVLMVSGYIRADDSAGFGPVVRSAAGTVNHGPGGSYAVQMLDGNGLVLSAAAFTPDSQEYTDPRRSTDIAPFLFSFEYPASGAQVRIIHENAILSTLNIATGLLYNAIKLLPDNAFNQTSLERRKALLNKIGAFDAQLSAGATQGAKNSLQNDIRKSLQDWLLDNYAVSSSLQYTKAQILDLVDELIQRLIA